MYYKLIALPKSPSLINFLASLKLLPSNILRALSFSPAESNSAAYCLSTNNLTSSLVAFLCNKLGEVVLGNFSQRVSPEGVRSNIVVNFPRSVCVPSRVVETRVLKVPKTTSPNLLQRKATKEEVKLLVDKQYAAELLSAGEKDKALSILEGSDFKDAKKLINEGDFGNAINLLTTEGKIDFTPKSLTYNTLFQQKLLFENFRMIRDIALNPSLTKPGLEIAKLSARDKKNWMKLDALPGSDRLRRMVAVSKQIDQSEVKELGWIPKSTFKELKEITGGEATEAVGGWMSFLSAIHKTSKTAWNIPTQFANAIGNWALLTNAGVNPFSKDFIDLQIKSASGVWQLQSAVRKGEDITKIKDLGKLDSLAIKGKKIDIAEELNS